VSAKLSVLRASQRLLRPGGRLAFFTISSAAGLSPADRRRALAAGPPELDGPDVSDLLRRAGFADVSEVDVTADYLVTTRAWRAARLHHRDTVRPIDPAMYDERLAKGENAIEAIETGLLRRTLHTATAT
jgi:cyclopropane fatty-acyl-phospholipid synthase-like methyltransferase